MTHTHRNLCFDESFISNMREEDISACPRTRSYLVLGVFAERVKSKSTRQARHWHGRAGHADVAEGAEGGEVRHDQEIRGERPRWVKKDTGGRRIRGDRSAKSRW